MEKPKGVYKTRREAKVSRAMNPEIHPWSGWSLQGPDSPALLHLSQTRVTAGSWSWWVSHGEWTISQPWPVSEFSEGGQWIRTLETSSTSGTNLQVDSLWNLCLPSGFVYPWVSPLPCSLHLVATLSSSDDLSCIIVLKNCSDSSFHTAWCKRLKKAFCRNVAHYHCTWMCILYRE